jgi:hypothetical protein
MTLVARRLKGRAIVVADRRASWRSVVRVKEMVGAVARSISFILAMTAQEGQATKSGFSASSGARPSRAATAARSRSRTPAMP